VHIEFVFMNNIHAKEFQISNNIFFIIIIIIIIFSLDIKKSATRPLVIDLHFFSL